MARVAKGSVGKAYGNPGACPRHCQGCPKELSERAAELRGLRDGGHVYVPAQTKCSKGPSANLQGGRRRQGTLYYVICVAHDDPLHSSTGSHKGVRQPHICPAPPITAPRLGASILERILILRLIVYLPVPGAAAAALQRVPAQESQREPTYQIAFVGIGWGSTWTTAVNAPRACGMAAAATLTPVSLSRLVLGCATC